MAAYRHGYSSLFFLWTGAHTYSPYVGITAAYCCLLFSEKDTKAVVRLTKKPLFFFFFFSTFVSSALDGLLPCHEGIILPEYICTETVVTQKGLRLRTSCVKALFSV